MGRRETQINKLSVATLHSLMIMKHVYDKSEVFPAITGISYRLFDTRDVKSRASLS